MTNEHDGDTLTAEAGPDGWDMVPTRLWLGGGIPVGADRVWIALMRRSKMSRDQATPRRTLIAADVGMGVRTVDGHLDALVRAGWLLITPRLRDGGKGQTSNHYAVLWNPIDSPDDPRLVAHQRAVEEFEQALAALAARKMTGGGAPADVVMGRRDTRKSGWAPEDAAARAEKYAARITAGQTPRAGSARGTTAPASTPTTPRRICTGPVQDLHGPRAGSAPLESVPLESVPLESREPLSADADDEVDPVGQLMIVTVAAPPPPSFEEFWSAYPRHVKRAPSKAKWDQLVRDGHDPAEIVAGARAYAEWCRAEGKPEQFIAHPSSWLNARRWTDVLVRSTPDPGPARMTAPDRRLALAQDTLARLRAREARSESRALAFPPTAPTALEAAR